MMLALCNSLVTPNAAVMSRLPSVISKVAALGDSVTEQNGGASGLITLYANGPIIQAHARMGANWDWEPDTANNKLTFATGGKRSDEVFTLHLAAVIASDADMVIEGTGLNDAVQGIAAATVAANRLAAWLAIRAAGKHCVPLPVIPIQLAVTNNGAGVLSARVVAINAACAAEAAANDFPYPMEVSTALEATPGAGDGVGDADCFDATLLHPDVLGCSRMGQELADFLTPTYTFGIDPFDMGGTNIQANGDFAAGATRPTSFTAGAPTNGSLGAETKSTSGGFNWWRIVCNKGTSTSVFFAQQFADDGTSEGLPCDAITVVRVISGTLDTLQLTYSSTQPGVVTDGQAFASGTGMALISADGNLYLRTRKKTIDPAATLTWPALIWKSATDCTIEIGYMSCRKF